MKKADHLKIFDGDEILIHLDQKQKGRWTGHLYDICCNCGFRHHSVYRVQVKNNKPVLSFETYSDFYGSKLRKKK